MSLWIQHGYGKSTKIWDLDDEGLVSGVILSPGDEDGTALSGTAAELQRREIPALLDPQAYVWSIPNGTARCHSDHGLDLEGLHWSMAPAEVEGYVERLIEVNERLGLEGVIAPTCFQRQLADNWAPLSLQFARATLARAESDRVYISVAVDEGALGNWDDVEEWLDLVTQFDARGFYLVVARPREYPQTWDPSTLTNTLRLIFRLSVLNEYDVLWGYSDLDGLAGLAAGASGLGSGWFYTLRSFSLSKWQPQVAGGPARPRATSALLLTPLIAEGEASRIVRASELADRILPANEQRQRLADPSSWSQADAWAQHLAVLGRLADTLSARDTVEERAEMFSRRVSRALRTLSYLTTEGVVLPPGYESRLRSLDRAFSDFADREGLV